MTRKALDKKTPKPVVVRVILTGELAIRFEGHKPKIQLTQLSDNRYEVNYVACGTTHWRVFDTLGAAEQHFRVLTGEITPRGRMVA